MKALTLSLPLALMLSLTMFAQEKPASEPAKATEAKKAPEKQWLYHIVPARMAMLKEGPTPEEAKALQGHVKYLTDLVANGTLILGGRTQTDDETTFGIVIFRAPDEDSARKIMNADPAVSGGVMKATLYPYQVAFKGK
jgi:uncharacterized protein